MVLVIDESGHDRKASPYEVLAGIAIRVSDLWEPFFVHSDLTTGVQVADLIAYYISWPTA